MQRTTREGINTFRGNKVELRCLTKRSFLRQVVQRGGYVHNYVKEKALLLFLLSLSGEINGGYTSTGFVYGNRSFSLYNSAHPIRKWPILQYGGSTLAGGTGQRRSHLLAPAYGGRQRTSGQRKEERHHREIT